MTVYEEQESNVPAGKSSQLGSGNEESKRNFPRQTKYDQLKVAYIGTCARLAAGKTPMSCSRGLKGFVSRSNSVGTSSRSTKSEANGA